MANITSDATRSLIQYFNVLGIPKTVCLNHIEMTEQMLFKKEFIDINKYLALYELGESTLNRKDLGFDYGKQINPSRWGVLGQIAYTSSNLKQILYSQQQFQSMTGSLGTPSFVVEKNFLTMNWQSAQQYSHYISEELITSWIELARQLTGVHFALSKVSFQHACPTDKSLYTDYFSCDVEFEASSYGFVVSASVLDLSCAGSNPELNKILTEYAHNTVGLHSVNNPVEVSLNYIKSQLPGSNPTIEELASFLGTSTRSIQRRLSGRDTNFSTLVDQVKQQLAIQYVIHTNHSFEHIGHILGFSELSAFSRAFKRWTTLSPAQFRKTLP